MTTRSSQNFHHWNAAIGLLVPPPFFHSISSACVRSSPSHMRNRCRLSN